MLNQEVGGVGGFKEEQVSAPIGRRRPCHVVGDGQSAASRLFGALRCQNRHRSNTSVALGRFGHFVFFSTIFFSDIWTFFFQSTLVLLSNPPLNTISVVFFLSYLGWKSWKKIRIIKVFLFFLKKKGAVKELLSRARASVVGSSL